MLGKGRGALGNKIDEKRDAAEKVYTGKYLRISKYFKRSLVVLTGLLIIAALVYVGVIVRNQKAAGNPGEPYSDPLEEPFSVLPQTERVNEQDQQFRSGSSLGGDPFAGPIYLVGVIQDSTGGLAIIETEAMTYVAACGDTITDHWILEIIQENSVLLKSNEKEMWLDLDGSGIIDIQ